MGLISKITGKKVQCYVHIGMHKTGSTSIQHTFSKNRKLLNSKHKLFYLPFGANHGKPITNLFKVSARTLREAKEIPKFNPRKEHSGEQLTQHLQKNAGKKVIISGEKLCSMDRRSVRRFKEFLVEHAEVVKVIAYVRNPIYWSSSWSQQLIKQGRSLIETCVSDPPTPEYERRLGSYLEFFGKENVKIRVFEEAVKHPQGVLGDFLEALDEDPKIAEQIEEHRCNESLSFECALLLNEVEKKIPLYVADTDEIAEGRLTQDANQLLVGIKGTKFTLPEASLKKVFEKSNADRTWLAKQIGRDPYAEQTISTNGVTQPAWNAQTIQELGIKLFELHHQCRKLEAEIAYRDAEALIVEGKRQPAAKLLRKALKLFPKHEEAKLRLRRLLKNPKAVAARVKKQKAGKTKAQRGGNAGDTGAGGEAKAPRPKNAKRAKQRAEGKAGRPRKKRPPGKPGQKKAGAKSE